MSSIKQVLMERDGLTSGEANKVINEAQVDLMQRLKCGDIPTDFCQEKFGLEPDYLFELLE